MVKKNNKKLFPEIKKGFTLIEVLVAMFIFSLMMVVAASFFADFMNSKREVKDAQENLEDAQYVMNLMAKVLRTSVIKNSNQNWIEVIDNSQSSQNCIKYEFAPNAVVQYKKDPNPDGSCPVFDNPVVLTNNVTGKFDAVASNDMQMGRVVILMNFSRGSNDLSIQTTVSLRDYEEAGI